VRHGTGERVLRSVYPLRHRVGPMFDSPGSLAMHSGTFQLMTEGIDEPVQAFEEARAPAFGESIRL